MDIDLVFFNTVDASGQTFQVCQAVFLPSLRKADTMSHPVKVLHTDPSLALTLPKCDPHLLKAEALQVWEDT